MKAGYLRDRVLFQRPNMVQDATGQEVPDPQEPWVDIDTFWASVSELSGRELTQARQRQGLLTHEIEIRWRPDIDETCRCIFWGRVMNILGPPRNPDGVGRGMTIDAAAQTTGSV